MCLSKLKKKEKKTLTTTTFTCLFLYNTQEVDFVYLWQQTAPHDDVVKSQKSAINTWKTHEIVYHQHLFTLRFSRLYNLTFTLTLRSLVFGAETCVNELKLTATDQRPESFSLFVCLFVNWLVFHALFLLSPYCRSSLFWCLSVSTAFQPLWH